MAELWQFIFLKNDFYFQRPLGVRKHGVNIFWLFFKDALGTPEQLDTLFSRHNPMMAVGKIAK